MLQEYYVRIILSLLCGGAIGYERKSHSKEAGVRTHVILAIGSCLIMIMSKYGFTDVNSGDPARLAAQVVSGVGFLGAGMILIRNNVVSGLTTAAGIWTTAAIGLAIGAGLWQLGVFTTVLVVAVEYLLRNSFFGYEFTSARHIKVVLTDKKYISDVDAVLKKFGVEILGMQFSKISGSSVEINYTIDLAKKLNEGELVEKLSDLEYVVGAEV